MDQIGKKQCQVCQDRAKSFNFNGLTCESCKAFFRRNVSQTKNLVCAFGGQCQITVFNRRNCARCRMDKCLAIGMKMEYVGINKKPHVKHAKSCYEILYNENFDSKLNYLSIGSGSGTSDSSDSSRLTTSTNLLAIASLCCTKFLRPYERQLVDEINDATTKLQEPLRKPSYDVMGYATNDRVGIFNMQELLVEKFIHFNKCINAVQRLTADDQLTVLKRTFVDIVVLRTVFFHHFEKDAFPIRANFDANQVIYVQLDFWYGSKHHELIRIHRQLAKLVKMEMENDVIIRDLIAILFMFEPRNRNRSITTNLEYSRYQQFVYQHLLRKYLENKYENDTKAKQKYDRLINIIIKQLGILKQGFIEIYKQFNSSISSSQISHTLMEIYDDEEDGDDG